MLLLVIGGSCSAKPYKYRHVLKTFCDCHQDFPNGPVSRAHFRAYLIWENNYINFKITLMGQSNSNIYF